MSWQARLALLAGATGAGALIGAFWGGPTKRGEAAVEGAVAAGGAAALVGVALMVQKDPSKLWRW